MIDDKTPSSTSNGANFFHFLAHLTKVCTWLLLFLCCVLGISARDNVTIPFTTMTVKSVITVTAPRTASFSHDTHATNDTNQASPLGHQTQQCSGGGWRVCAASAGLLRRLWAILQCGEGGDDGSWAVSPLCRSVWPPSSPMLTSFKAEPS